MKNFEALLQEIRTIAKSVTSDEFKKDCEEYKEKYAKRNYDLFLAPNNNDDDYTLTNQYFSMEVFNTFTDDTYSKAG